MYNPLKVSLENIIPLTEARDHFSQIVSEVQKDKLYVLTKGGKPAVAIIDVKYLEHITGGHVDQKKVNEEIQKNPQKVGIPPMIEHKKETRDQRPTNIPPPPSDTIPPAPEPKTESTSPPPPPPTPEAPVTPEPHKKTPPISSPDANNQQPGATSPLSMPQDTVEVQMAPDVDDHKKQNTASNQTALGDLNSPDDKVNPAQYDGENQEREKDDMMID